MEDQKDIKMDSQPSDEMPSRSKDLSKTLPEEAFNNFLQGKRNMLVQDYTYAVQSLAKACELYTQHFGELALECGEVYFLYGKALFRLSQQQAGVLGDALNEGTTEDDDEQEKSSEESKENESEKSGDSESEGEENKDAAEVGEDAEAGEEEKEPSESTDSPQTVADDAASKDSTGKESEPVNSETASTSNETMGEDNQQEAEEDDLELAWNSLETAKTIFLRQGTNNVEAQLKVADILQLLAEISMESDNNAAAINDLEACLKIKKQHLKPDDRILAETYYQMGLAQMLDKMYDEAIENFTNTMNILELRKENLKNTPVPDTVGSFERADVEKEIEDLDGVMADIREKIEDTKELIQNAKKDLEEAIIKKETEQVGFAKVEKPESSSKPISNITHLLKRKKPDQEDDKESESKRIKLTSNIQNGDTTVTE